MVLELDTTWQLNHGKLFLVPSFIVFSGDMMKCGFHQETRFLLFFSFLILVCLTFWLSLCLLGSNSLK